MLGISFHFLFLQVTRVELRMLGIATVSGCRFAVSAGNCEHRDLPHLAYHMMRILMATATIVMVLGFGRK